MAINEQKGGASQPTSPDSDTSAEVQKLEGVAFAWVGYYIPKENLSQFDEVEYPRHKVIGLAELGESGLIDAGGYRREGGEPFDAVDHKGNRHFPTRIAVAAYDSKEHRNGVIWTEGPGKAVLDDALDLADRLDGTIIAIKPPELPEDAVQFLTDVDPRIDYPTGLPPVEPPAVTG